MPESGGKHEPEQLRKMFIGGLDYTTKDEGLKEFYEQWGTVVDVVVMKDPKTRRSRGFGFITYSDAYMVDEAMANRPHKIDGRQVEPKRAVPRDLCGKIDTNVRKLFIGGLGKNIEKEDLEKYFGQFGKLTDCAIVVTKDTGEKRGFGFVEYEDVDSADKVVLMKEHEVNGRRVEVKKAIAREEIRGGRDGGGRGGGGRGRDDDRRGGRGGRDDYRGGQDSWSSNSNQWGGGGGGGNYNNPWGNNGGSGGGSWGGNMGGGGGGGNNSWNNPWNSQGFSNQGFNSGMGGMNPMMGGNMGAMGGMGGGMGNMGGMGATGDFSGGYNSGYGGGTGTGTGYNAAGTGNGGYNSYSSGGYNSGTGGGGGGNSYGGSGGTGGPMRSSYNSSHRSAPYSAGGGGGRAA